MNQRVHPMTIVAGWRTAVQIARGALESAAVDHSADPTAFREDLLNIARTTLSSKLLNAEKNHFAELAVDAVLRLQGSGNLEYIQVIKKPGGTLSDSFLENGFVLDKSFGVGQVRLSAVAHMLLFMHLSRHLSCIVCVDSPTEWKTPRSYWPTPLWTRTRSRSMAQG